MPNIDDIYPSKWMRAADLKGTSQKVTIENVDVGTIGEKQQIILEFRGGHWKPLGLNKTNAQAIGDIFGSDTDDWIEQEIVLFPTRVDFQGKMVDAVRVDDRATRKLMQERLKRSKAPAAKPQVQPVTQAEVDAADDDIPF